MKKRTMEQIRKEVTLFLTDHPEADYNAVISHFGEPETIAAAYVESMGTAEILRKLRIRRRIVSAVAIVLAFVVITWAMVVTWEIHRNTVENEGFAIVSID
jgi:hypothetical protein